MGTPIVSMRGEVAREEAYDHEQEYLSNGHTISNLSERTMRRGVFQMVELELTVYMLSR